MTRFGLGGYDAILTKPVTAYTEWIGHRLLEHLSEKAA